MPLQKTPAPTRGVDSGRGLVERTAVIRLCDAYAGLLTAHQRDLLRMYYGEDFSLGEIAERLRISRQAVYDGLRRAVGEMRHLEERLGVLAAGRRNGRTLPRAAGRRAGPRRRGGGAPRREPRPAAPRLSRVEREAARLTRAGAATGPLLRALRALRRAMPAP
jgi:predicted DNA-binding protein YlxM (UPF0122 family)